MITRMIAAALALFVAFKVAPPSRAEIITRPPPPVEVEVRPGVTVKYLALSPKPKARAAVILFAGGNGLLNLQPNGSIGTNLSRNFLVRSRGKFVQQNLFVAVVDTPNQVKIDGNVRLSAQYAEDMSRVIADVRTRSGASRVWLVGTSAGTISAASIAARLPRMTPTGTDNERRPDGIVLTATQTTVVKGLCGRTVFNAQLAAVNVPAFLAHHAEDGCKCSPAKSAAKVLAALTGALDKGNQIFSGGLPPKSPDPCMAMTPHGFLGIEDTVVATVAEFIRGH